jgi:hypothetical protein
MEKEKDSGRRPTPSALSPSVGRVREKEMGSDEFFYGNKGVGYILDTAK